MFRKEAVDMLMIPLIIVAGFHLLSGYVAYGGALILLHQSYPVAYPLAVVVLVGLGFGLFFIAKRSVIRQGVSISFGFSRMSPRHRRMYCLGYCLLGLSFILALPWILGPAQVSLP